MIPRPEINLQALDDELRRLTECKHDRLETRKKAKSDGTVEFKRQCLNCGDRIGNAVRMITMTLAEQNAVPAWDYELEKTHYAKRNDLRIQLLRNEEKRKSDEWDKAYELYLTSDEWKRKRELVMLRANRICEGCRVSPAVQVHHLTYANVQHEFLWELVAVCEPCHKRAHIRRPLLSELTDSTQNSRIQPSHDSETP